GRCSPLAMIRAGSPKPVADRMSRKALPSRGSPLAERISCQMKTVGFYSGLDVAAVRRHTGRKVLLTIMTRQIFPGSGTYTCHKRDRHPEVLAATWRASNDGPHALAAILRDAAQARGSSRMMMNVWV